MVRLAKFFVINTFLILISTSIFADTTQNTQTIVGYWQTIDGKTQKPSSIIQIQPAGQFYKGTIVKTFKLPDEKPLKDKKSALGLVIINDMTCTSTVCRGGTILDPRDGKVYHATMKLVENGEKLRVRGYVGMPMFGKTVVWQRVAKI